MRPVTNAVCIQRDFCPLCYRGGARPERVPRDSARIDAEQAACSRAFCGLPLLDLAAEGERCRQPCKLNCLVCGNVMAFACEPEFEEALEAVEQYEQESLETRVEVLEGLKCLGFLGAQLARDVERRFARRLRTMGMAWYPAWNRLVHARCVKKAAGCECLVPVGVETCRRHGKRVVVAKRQRPAAVPDSKEKIDMPTPAPAASSAAGTSESAGARPTSVVKASWIASSKKGVAVPVHRPPVVLPKPGPRKADARLESAAAGCARLDTNAGLVQGPAAGAAPPRPGMAPPIKKRDHKLEVASKLSTRLDGWMGTTPANAQCLPESTRKARPRTSQDEATCLDRARLPTRHPCFCAKRHRQEFDPYQHGYLRKNGVDMYRFYDGFEVRVFSAVNELTEDGSLLPC